MGRVSILGITPARGGSKRIPRKNIKTMAGKPLLVWTIEAAIKAKTLDRYIVSTEDEEIAQLAQKHGAEVIWRPKELASDYASTLSVLQHAIQQIPCDVVVLLQATSPIRGDMLIDSCVHEFLENNYDSLATGFICKALPYPSSPSRTQDIEGFFCDDGNIYIIKASLIKNGDRYGKKIGKKVISRWENVDIDDLFDFWLAEKILEHQVVKHL